MLFSCPVCARVPSAPFRSLCCRKFVFHPRYRWCFVRLGAFVNGSSSKAFRDSEFSSPNCPLGIVVPREFLSGRSVQVRKHIRALLNVGEGCLIALLSNGRPHLKRLRKSAREDKGKRLKVGGEAVESKRASTGRGGHRGETGTGSHF